MTVIFDQLKQVIRRLAKAPLFTAVTLLTLAVGIGANTAVFAVVEGVLLKPLECPQPEQLIGVWENAPQIGFNDNLNISQSIYFIDRDQNTTLEDIGVYNGDSFNVTGAGQPAHVTVLDVTDGTLPILGVKPLLGRLFTRRDDSPNAPQTVLLSYAYWQSHFSGSRSVIGQTIDADGKSRQIIGVLPRDFHFLDWPDPAMVVPMQWDRGKIKLGNFSYEAVARLKPGVTQAQAHADLERLMPQVLRSFPAPNGFSVSEFAELHMGVSLHPLKQDVVGNIGDVLWVLMASIGIVLLVACANVANLLLVRVEGRRQELAIRTALGAGRGRITRGLLFESVVLALTGSLLGLGLAFAALRVLVAIAPTGLPRLHEIAIDLPVLLFTLAVALFVGLIIGSIPAIKYGGQLLFAGLREGGRALSQSRERHRARKTLVVVQVALALVLLICSGLMIRTFFALTHVDPGFTSPSTLETFKLYIPEARIPDGKSEQVARMEQEIAERLHAIPGVSSVGIGTSVPMDGWSSNDLVFARDRVYKDGQIPPIRRFKFISPGFFSTLGAPMVAGRDLTWTNTFNKLPVAIVSDNFAKDYWGSAENALGKEVRVTPADPWRQIIGVVADIHDDGVRKAAPTSVYWPLLVDHFEGQTDYPRRYVTYVLRTPRAGSAALLEEVQRAVWSIDSDLPLANPTTLGALYTKSMAQTSFTLIMLCVAGSMALLLGILGIYGVISYAVSQRTREIGIRMALGAERQELIALFVRQGLWLTVVGVVFGLGAAFAVMRLLSSLLFNVSPMDPATYILAALSVLGIAWLACFLPSRRAAAVDPVHALRVE